MVSVLVGSMNVSRFDKHKYLGDDKDNDGVTNENDNCPTITNADQNDSDGDGVGDVCDNCPNDANPGQEDENNNYIGDACDGGADNDGDGIPDDIDNCPSMPNSDQLDTDKDGKKLKINNKYQKEF